MNGSTWSLAIVDHQLPDGAGMRRPRRAARHDPSMPIVMLTGQGSDEMAIEAFRHGASDYVVKGGGDLDALAKPRPRPGRGMSLASPPTYPPPHRWR